MEKPLDGMNLPSAPGERVIDKPELPAGGIVVRGQRRRTRCLPGIRRDADLGEQRQILLRDHGIAFRRPMPARNRIARGVVERGVGNLLRLQISFEPRFVALQTDH